MKHLLLLLLLGGITYRATYSECPDWTTFHTNNKITPNNDNINEVWKITYSLNCWKDVEFWVYNDKNEEIYHDYGSSFDLYPFWEGKIKGEYVPNGTYSYIIKATKINTGKSIEKTGQFKMIR
jgi:gliding motility-associated-like protein